MMKNAEQVVTLMLETQAVRVCAHCDKEHPLAVGPGQVKSHGICRKHAKVYVESLLGDDPEFLANFLAQPDSLFSPSHP
jgi:hypothetical protein